MSQAPFIMNGMTKHLRKSAVALSMTTVILSPVSATAQTTVAPVIARAATGDLSVHGGARRQANETVQAERARNVILLIGDGMGDSEITIARNYAHGAGGYFKGIDALPITGQYTHYSLDRETGKPVYVTDSAASATAWASGIKTYNGALGIDIRLASHPTLLELSKKARLGTGLVSTAAIQDATPAAQISHVVNRACFGPKATSRLCSANALENGGAGSITEQLLDVRPDVVLAPHHSPIRPWRGVGRERLSPTRLELAAFAQ